MTVKHTAGSFCPACHDKLLDAHPELQAWFLLRKAQNQELHIAWSFRNRNEQNAAYAAGETKYIWPTSKHNRTTSGGIPLSDALDLFFQDIHGVGRWPFDEFKKVSDESKADNAPILWGHDFKTNPEDEDHFERTDC